MSDETFADRQLLLVQALHERTKDGRVDWVQDSDQTFRAAFDDFYLRIRLIPDNDYPSEPDYALELWNRENNYSERLVETISNRTLRPVMDKTTRDGLNPYALLEQIYELARRQALKVDDALERILTTLKGP